MANEDAAANCNGNYKKKHERRELVCLSVVEERVSVKSKNSFLHRRLRIHRLHRH